MTTRIDILLTLRGLTDSRNRAQELIRQKKVRVGGLLVSKASQTFEDDAHITLDEDLLYVSRAGYKLAGALEQFSIDVTGMVALDIGSSTGGFTDCLLKHGARHVYAVDVGTDQFSAKLKGLPTVSLFEQTDIRDFNPPPLPLDIITIDVSFISVIHLIPRIALLSRPGTHIICLVKPQFELSREKLNKNGIVKSEADALEACVRVENAFAETGFRILGRGVSPLKGTEGNTEYLLHLSRI
jgi:23S rRNA (cytidine1920-2'-O)/16S rRNA (cytidine1409-2'-O)-methyltransferase